jgi:hypothetical protein
VTSQSVSSPEHNRGNGGTAEEARAEINLRSTIYARGHSSRDHSSVINISTWLSDTGGLECGSP